MKCYTIDRLLSNTGIITDLQRIMIRSRGRDRSPDLFVPIPAGSHLNGSYLSSVPDIRGFSGGILLLLDCSTYLRLRRSQSITQWITIVRDELDRREVQIRRNQGDEFTHDPQDLGFEFVVHVQVGTNGFVGLYIVPSDISFEIVDTDDDRDWQLIGGTHTDCITYVVHDGELYSSNPRAVALDYIMREAMARTFGGEPPTLPRERFSKLEVD